MLKGFFYLIFYALGLTLSLLSSFAGLVHVFGPSKENLILELLLLPGCMAATAYSFHYITENISRFANIALCACLRHLIPLQNLYDSAFLRSKKSLSFPLVKGKATPHNVSCQR